MSFKAVVKGLEQFGEVEITKTLRQNGHPDRLIGVVLVPRNWPGSSNIGAPNEHVSIMGVVSYDQSLGNGWELL